jgi:hypothetical protein
VGGGGGGGLSFQKPKKYLKKELKTGDIKLPMFLHIYSTGTLIVISLFSSHELHYFW